MDRSLEGFLEGLRHRLEGAVSGGFLHIISPANKKIVQVPKKIMKKGGVSIEDYRYTSKKNCDGCRKAESDCFRNL